MQRPQPLRAGDVLKLDIDGLALECICESVTQRNWSRVATGTCRIDSAPRKLFLKQFRHRDGRWDAAGVEFEASGASLASRSISAATVAPPIGGSRPQLVLAYPYVEISTPDEMLRTDPARLAGEWSRLCSILGRMLSELTRDGATSMGGLAKKERSYPSSALALVFKGLDIRNFGFVRSTGAVTFFDVGKPYLAPVEEAAAKLLVSVLLLNWGRPLRRFAAGPPTDLAARFAPEIGNRLSAVAIETELDLQLEIRRSEPKSSSRLGRAAKSAVVAQMGDRYIRACRHWSRSAGL